MKKIISILILFVAIGVKGQIVGGFVPLSRSITINGVSQNLSANRTWTISVPSVTNLVPYTGGSTALTFTPLATFSDVIANGTVTFSQSATNLYHFQQWPAAPTLPAFYIGVSTPTTNNYAILGDGTNNYFNSGGSWVGRATNTTWLTANTTQTTNAATIDFASITTATMGANQNLIGFRKNGALVTWSVGTTATQRENHFTAPTYSALTTATITDAVGLENMVPTAGTGMTFTRVWGLRSTGNTNLTGSVIIGSALTTSPTAQLDIVGNVRVTTTASGSTAIFQNNTASATNFIESANTANNVSSHTGYVITTNTGRIGYFLGQASAVTLANAKFGIAGSVLGISADATPIVFSPNGINALSNAMVINTANNVGIGSGSLATLPASLSVYGTMSVSSTATIAGNSLFQSSVGIGEIPFSALSKFRVNLGTAGIDLGQVSAGNSGLWLLPSTSTANTTNYVLQQSGSDLLINNGGANIYFQTAGGNSRGVWNATGLRVGSSSSASATLDVTGTMSVSSTTTLNGVSYIGSNLIGANLVGSATLDFASTVAGAVTDMTLTVTGASAGDVVSIGVPNGSMPAAGVYQGWVSATNVVSIRFANNALVTTYDPASGTFKATVNKN